MAGRAEEKLMARRLMRVRRQDHEDPVRLQQLSELAQGHVIGLPEFQVGLAVACYVAMAGEVRTERIMTEAWKRGKRVAVPAFRPDAGHYGFALLERDAVMKLGRWDILEPATKEWISVDDLDVVVTPGVAFDLEGGRLGHGGGYYDRLLTAPGAATESDVVKIGLAFEFQIVDEVPMDPTDVRMNVLVTEERTIRIR